MSNSKPPTTLYSKEGIEFANSYGVYGNNMGIESQMAKMSINDTTNKPGGKGGKSKRSNSRKKIRKNRRANKTRRYKK